MLFLLELLGAVVGWMCTASVKICKNFGVNSESIFGKVWIDWVNNSECIWMIFGSTFVYL